MKLNDFPIGEVANELIQGTVIPFLGAGASQVGVSAQDTLPDGRGLAKELIDRMRPAYRGTPADGLAKVAEYFEQAVFDRSRLVDYLHQRLYVQQLNAPLARVAQLLATMPKPDDRPRFIMTTNYDTFIERAFSGAGRPLCVITQNMRDPDHGGKIVTLKLPDGATMQDEARDFLVTDPRIPAGTTFLFKMHGSADRNVTSEFDALIITETDYVDFLVNAGSALQQDFPPRALQAEFRNRRFLFLGYSLADWNFRVFLRLLSLNNAISKRPQLRHWAIQLRPGQVDVKLWDRRNVNVYDGSLSQFCDRLEAAWASQGTP